MSNDLDDFDQWLIDLPENEPGISPEYSGMPHFGVQEFKNVEHHILPELSDSLSSLKRWYRTPSLDAVPVTGLNKTHFPHLIEAIRSMVGDDEVITSNSLLYCILAILLGPICARIKISWEDVQFSQWLFNYAEGYILLPMSKDSDFESVNRYNRGAGVPFVLDPVKFKDLSAVRKQSAMDVDLPSKFRNLAQRAAWTNPSWFTWGQHQHALILGIEIFDFMRSSIFPFLFQWEGGCGGAPPFNNVHTAAGMVFRFRSGRAKQGILGIMTDSNRLQKGEIRPAEAFFTKNLNLALSGDKRWLQVRSELERRKDSAEEYGTDWDRTLRDNAERTIPRELVEKGVAIDPEDAYTGVSLSFLREKGYITTELDLVERQEAEFRLKSIWGPIPMQEIEDQIAVRKDEYQSSFHEELTELFKLEPHNKVYEHFRNLGDPFSDEALAEMREYYKIRVQEALRFNSFIYNERVMVFKTSDVDTYYDRGSAGIRDGFAKSVDVLYRPEHARRILLPDERGLHNDIQKWIDSGGLKKLLTEPIPPGIGPDDSRILRDLISFFLIKKGEGCTGGLAIIVTSDVQMVFSAQRILTHELGREFKIRVVGLKTDDYIQWSLTSADTGRPSFDRRKTYVIPHKRESRMNPQEILLNKAQLFNLVSKKKQSIDGALRTLLIVQLQHLWNVENPCIRVEYDYPNINRRCLRLQFDNASETVYELSGGFLSKQYVESSWKFPIMEFGDIRDLKEFETGHRRSYYKAAHLGTRYRLIIPKSFST